MGFRVSGLGFQDQSLQGPPQKTVVQITLSSCYVYTLLCLNIAIAIAIATAATTATSCTTDTRTSSVTATRLG